MGNMYMYMTENNTVDVRVVEVGITEGDDVAIISGLNEGDKGYYDGWHLCVR